MIFVPQNAKFVRRAKKWGGESIDRNKNDNERAAIIDNSVEKNRQRQTGKRQTSGVIITDNR